MMIQTKNKGKLGHPKYNYDEEVNFRFGKDKVLHGKIYIIDRYGTFEQNEEPSYDIYNEKDNVIYKHVRENSIIEN